MPDDLTVTSVRLPPETLAALDEWAAKEGRDRSNLIRLILAGAVADRLLWERQQREGVAS